MGRVLLIEDSVTDAHLAKRVITREKLADEIDWVMDGAEAMEVLHTVRRDRYQLVLLDIKLPKMTGLDILRELSGQNVLEEFPPIVIFSSSNQERDIQEAMKYGAADYYTKPEGYQALKSTLKKLCKRWMPAN